MNSIEEVLNKHGLNNINEAIELMYNSPSEKNKNKKPICKKCKREVDYCEVINNFCEMKYYLDVKCHGKEEIVYGDMNDSIFGNEYQFEG